MFEWLARGICVWCAAVTIVRCRRDRYTLGLVLAALVGVLVVLERLWPTHYFAFIGTSAALATLGTVATVLRDRRLPAACTQQRDLLTPFLGLAGTTCVGVIVSLLAHSLSGP